MFGKKVEINFAVTGLYSVTLNNSLSDENTFKSNIFFFHLSYVENFKIALKLHQQFLHPHSDRLLYLS